uniref:5'-3' DNA helicase ZGRF1-like N-terminal domain-containing protein n=1 Tax=Aquila chrysaetos chrysaetos TaxID=223781 RepID=A0A663FBY7_AQUCH
MASQEFTVLYTHQKMKKSKTWQDGILRIRTGGNKAILFDDKGQCLESIFIKSQVYFFQCVFYFYGFQGPRQVEKKISTMEDGENPTILPLSKHCQGTFPSKFYVTSPLFSTICKKDAETNLSADFHEDVRTDNDGEHTSLSSLLSAPFLGRCEETERQNSDRSIVKPESPPVTGHTKSSSQTAGHGAVSCNIRSTAQIIALLESKPTQGCRDQTSSEVTECLFRSQASENADSLYRQKPSILPAFSGNPAKRLIQNIQHLPFTKGTVNDKKEWNAEMLLNSAEQPCDKEATGQRHDKKAYNLSQDLQDPCNTNSCFLPESTRSRRSDSQFVPSSGDVSCSVSPITFEKNLSRYREDSSVKLQSELQPRQNSERIPSDQELSVDVTLTKIGFVKEELSMHGKDCGPDEQVMEVNFNLMEAFDFNDTDNEDLCERDVNKFTEGDMLSQSPRCLKGEDVAQNAALRLHSCCEVVTHSKNEEVKCSTFDGENGGNNCTEGIPSQLCDNDVGDTGRTAEDSANQTRIEVELLGNGHNVRETNDSQLSIEATNNKKDIDGCAAHTIDGTSWINSKHSDLLPGDTNVNECPPKTSMFEKTESISCISTSRIISAMDKRTEEDVQLECIKSPDVDLEHFWGTRSDDIKPGSPLLALSQKSEPSYGSFQYITEGHQKVFGISHKEDTLISRNSIYPLRNGRLSLEETAIGKTEFENAESINAFHEACKGEGLGTDCLKCTAMAENSSDLPDLVKNIALLRALTQHSTPLESLQEMEENNSVLYEAETSKEIFEPPVKDEG